MQEIKTGTDHTNSISRNLNFLKKYSVIMQNIPASTKPIEIIYITLIFLADKLYINIKLPSRYSNIGTHILTNQFIFGVVIAFITARYTNAAMKSMIIHFRKVFFLIIIGVIAQHHAKTIDGMA